MSAKSLRWTIVALIAGSPAALALGLGDIHLHSALNAPLDADIDLVGATADDLSGLKAQLASRDAFSRNGLDYPSFLSTLTFSTVHTADGHDLIKVRSAQPITEPFVTLLVELDWARGRVQHEYTVLLDPPVYAPGAAAAAPVAAPVSGAGNRAGNIQRQATSAAPPAPLAPAPTPAAAPAASDAAASGSYTVRRGDSLSRIAGQYAGGSGRERWMVAAYDANRGAFDGNMNTLRSGTVLRLPGQAQVAAVSAGEAVAEVHRQFAAWRSGQAGAGQTAASASADAGRLHLVTPGSPQPAAAGGAGQGAGAAANAAQVQQLQAQLAESQRLVQVQQAELAKLQAQLAAREGGKAPAPPAPVQEQAQQAPAVAPPAVAAASAPAAEASAPAAETGLQAQDSSVQARSAPASSPVQQPVRRKPHITTVPVTPEAGPLDLVRHYWWALVALLAAAAAWAGVRKWRERQQDRFDDSLGHLATMPATQAHAVGDEHLARPEPMVVEESSTRGRPQTEDIPSAAPHVDVGAGPEGLSPDPGGALAEADFHMAYGLYDQAADLIRAAIQREPDRRDLRLKLLEVFFVWGNKEQFLEAAHGLAATRDQASPGEWEKILIMGKQLVPEDALFAGGSASGAAAGGMDLDFGGEPGAGLHFDGTDTGVDLDIGTALAGDDHVTAETAVGATDKNLALHLPDDHGHDSGATLTGATRLMSPPRAPGALDEFDLDGNTVEQPQAGYGATGVRDKLESALKQTPQVDETAELALDDLGLDLGALDAPDAEQEHPHMATGADAPTLVAGLDEHSRELLATAEQPMPGFEAEADAATGKWKFDSTDLATQLAPVPDAAATSALKALDPDDVDFDLGQVEVEHEHEHGVPVDEQAARGVDLDVGAATLPDVQLGETQRVNIDDLALPDLEPVTMSEVGTKLDLARAYMDMGDPEGARNILEEVVKEGSQSQQQEAQRLIESLPG